MQVFIFLWEIIHVCLDTFRGASDIESSLYVTNTSLKVSEYWESSNLLSHLLSWSFTRTFFCTLGSWNIVCLINRWRYLCLYICFCDGMGKLFVGLALSSPCVLLNQELLSITNAEWKCSISLEHGFHFAMMFFFTLSFLLLQSCLPWIKTSGSILFIYITCDVTRILSCTGTYIFFFKKDRWLRSVI